MNELELLDKSGQIISPNPSVIYNECPYLIVCLYQDEHIISWLEYNLDASFFRLDKEYLLLYHFVDVVEYNRDLIEAIVDMAIKKTLSNHFIFYNIGVAMRQEPLLLDDCGPKGIILILKEEK